MTILQATKIVTVPNKRLSKGYPPGGGTPLPTAFEDPIDRTFTLKDAQS
jgi:hypothetical protein